MKILTFDIEEWIVNEMCYGSGSSQHKKYDDVLNHILDVLDENNTNATFFCLGKLAADYPDVIRRIHSRGHEVGSHSYAHKWVNKITPEEFEEDTYAAISRLEDITGEKVLSFRAPAFSIGNRNKWAIDVLVRNGIKNDASIFPGKRDFGGFPNFTEQSPCIISYNGCKINEFPIPLYKVPVIGMDLAYSGGGYFRMLPFGFVRKHIFKADYSMCYFHIADLLRDNMPFQSREEYESYFKESGYVHKRLIRYLKANIGRRSAMGNLEKLISTAKFTSIRDYLQVYTPSKVIEI